MDKNKAVSSQPSAVREKELRERIENDFTYHKPFGDQPERYEFIRGLGKITAYGFCDSCPQSRELSLALTKLEEAVFWANAAIARNETPPPADASSTPPKESGSTQREDEPT